MLSILKANEPLVDRCVTRVSRVKSIAGFYSIVSARGVRGLDGPWKVRVSISRPLPPPFASSNSREHREFGRHERLKLPSSRFAPQRRQNGEPAVFTLKQSLTVESYPLALSRVALNSLA